MSFIDDFNKSIKDPKQAALYSLGAQNFQKTGNMANPAWLLFLHNQQKEKEKNHGK